MSILVLLSAFWSYFGFLIAATTNLDDNLSSSRIDARWPQPEDGQTQSALSASKQLNVRAPPPSGPSASGQSKIESPFANTINWTIESEGQELTASLDVTNLEWSTVIQTYDPVDLTPKNFSLKELNDTYNRLNPAQRKAQLTFALKGKWNMVNTAMQGLESLEHGDPLARATPSNRVDKRWWTDPWTSASRVRKLIIRGQVCSGVVGVLNLLCCSLLPWYKRAYDQAFHHYQATGNIPAGWPIPPELEGEPDGFNKVQVFGQSILVALNCLFAWLAYTHLEEWRDWTLINCWNALLCKVYQNALDRWENPRDQLQEARDRLQEVRDLLQEERNRLTATRLEEQRPTGRSNGTEAQQHSVPPPQGSNTQLFPEGVQTSPPQQADPHWASNSSDRLELGPQAPTDNALEPTGDFDWEGRPTGQRHPFSAPRQPTVSSRSFLSSLSLSLRQSSLQHSTRRRQSGGRPVVDIEMGPGSQVSVPAEFLEFNDTARLRDPD